MVERYTQVPRTTPWLLPEDECEIGGSDADAQPAFTAEVGPFYIGKSLITNEQYEAFDPAHERAATSDGDDDPVVGVSFRDAVAYCQWYSALSRKRFRLPTEVEWERACRGGTTSRYFWGDEPAGGARFAWTAETSSGRAHPIESLPANPAGLHDLIGLAWEWTASLHRPYPIVDGDGRDDLEERGERVLRGGSYRSSVSELSCGLRRPAAEDLRADDVGFRIVRSL